MQEILDLGKPIRESSLRREPLAALCATAVDLWRQTASYPEHQVRLATPLLAPDAAVLCDSAKIQQVLLNLLDNAADHRPPALRAHWTSRRESPGV